MQQCCSNGNTPTTDVVIHNSHIQDNSVTQRTNAQDTWQKWQRRENSPLQLSGPGRQPERYGRSRNRPWPYGPLGTDCTSVQVTARGRCSLRGQSASKNTDRTRHSRCRLSRTASRLSTHAAAQLGSCYLKIHVTNIKRFLSVAPALQPHPPKPHFKNQTLHDGLSEY